MNPEIWTLASSDAVKEMLESLAVEEQLRLRHFSDLPAALDQSEETVTTE